MDTVITKSFKIQAFFMLLVMITVNCKPIDIPSNRLHRYERDDTVIQLFNVTALNSNSIPRIYIVDPVKLLQHEKKLAKMRQQAIINQETSIQTKEDLLNQLAANNKYLQFALAYQKVSANDAISNHPPIPFYVPAYYHWQNVLSSGINAPPITMTPYHTTPDFDAVTPPMINLKDKMKMTTTVAPDTDDNIEDYDEIDVKPDEIASGLEVIRPTVSTTPREIYPSRINNKLINLDTL